MTGSQNILLAIARSPKTVFTMQSLMMLSGIYDRRALTNTLYYYRKKGLIDSPRAGIYVKENYDEREMACALSYPSYLSLQYVLSRAGVVFQYSEAVTCVSAVSREITVDGKTYLFRRIKPELWAAQRGIEQYGGFCMACPERALLDMMYLYPEMEFFDRTERLSPALLLSLSMEYGNRRLERRIKEIYG